MKADKENNSHRKRGSERGDRLEVSEFLGQFQGASSPFGDLKFPLPADQLRMPGAEHLSD